MRDRTVDRYANNIIIIAHKRDGCTGRLIKVLADQEELNWREYEGLPIVLTLMEIGNQLSSLGYEPPFYIWDNNHS